MSLESIRGAIQEEISKLNQALQLLGDGATGGAPGRKMSAIARARSCSCRHLERSGSQCFCK
jgi:hypothetical protein